MSDAQVLGGYKATLSNPNTSDAAKQHAQEVLDGSADVGSKSSSNIKSSSGDSSANDDGTPSNRVLGGHKAAIHNDSVPEESKERSRQVLKDAGVDAE